MSEIENKLITCSICLEENIDNDELCKTNCNHIFCKKCLDDWFNKGKNTCPLCRDKIDFFEYKNEKNKIILIETKDNNINVNNIQQLLNNNNLNLNEIQVLLRNLMIRNARLKCYLFISLFTSINYISNYYFCSYYNNQLNNELGICDNNNTIINNNLNSCENFLENINDELNNNLISVNVYDNGQYTKCNIPALIYDSCFNN